MPRYRYLLLAACFLLTGGYLLASQAFIPSDLYVQGTLSAKSFTPPAGCVTDAAVATNAGIEATKIVHQLAKEVNQPAGTNVASATNLIHQVFPAGSNVSTVAGFLSSIVSPPTGADTITVDLQRSTSGGAFATVLTSVITFTSSTPARTVQTASIATASLNNGDILQVVVTYNHSSGGAGQGLIAEAFLRENPQ